VSVTRIPRSGCGIVARPIAAAGFGSAFISELIGPSEVRWLCGQLKRRSVVGSQRNMLRWVA